MVPDTGHLCLCLRTLRGGVLCSSFPCGPGVTPVSDNVAVGSHEGRDHVGLLPWLS